MHSSEPRGRPQPVRRATSPTGARGLRRVVVAAALVAIAANPIGPQVTAVRSASSDGAMKVIDAYREQIPKLMVEQGIPGLAVALVDGDQIVWLEGFGYTDTDDRAPIDVHTIFSVQSMSKVFTATAVMQAVEAGLVDLDVPITTYLPDFTVHSAFEANPEQKITLRMLLSHTAGFTHEAPLGNNYEAEAGDFDAHVLTISDTWLRFRVGTGYAYSNLGIDLAGYILERVTKKSFPDLMRDSLLAPLGMTDSTFDRAEIHAAANRAVGHDDSIASPPMDVPMMAAGGLWASAVDLAEFLKFQLGNGTIGDQTLLDAALIEEMRTVPAPDAGAPAGYALGVARTRWRAGRYLDLFSHGGAGYGFLSDLWWLPQLQLGIAVLTNSTTHDLHGALPLAILHDLITEPTSEYYARIQALPFQSDVIEPDDHWVAPGDLPEQIAAVAMPGSSDQGARWARYEGAYRAGKPGEMNPGVPPARFVVADGVAYFDATEDGTAVRHEMTEFQPGLFLSEDGQTLDLRGPKLFWRGIDLNRVTGGPLPWQWGLLAVVAIVTVGWLAGSAVSLVRRRFVTLRRRDAAPAPETGPVTVARTWRRITIVVAALGAILALACIAAIVLLPGLVDVGFLGSLPGMAFTFRLLFSLPLATAVLAAGLVGLVIVGWARRWWAPQARPRDAALVVALAVLATQLAAWNLVGWAFG